MKHVLHLMIAMIALSLTCAFARPPANENIAEGIVAARKKDAAKLSQYNWNSRTEILQDGKVLDIRIDQVNIGPDGQLQRVELNDQKSHLPGLFMRKRIEEKKRKETEHLLRDLSGMLESYTLPGSQSVISFIGSAQTQPITSPEGQTLLQMTGSGVVVAGDTLSITVNPSTMDVTRMQITTMYNGHQVQANVTFHKSATAGMNHLQFADIEVLDTGASMQVHNYDYVPND